MAHSEALSTEPLHKRKRDADENGQQPRDRIPQPPPPQSGTSPPPDFPDLFMVVELEHHLSPLIGCLLTCPFLYSSLHLHSMY